LPVASQNFELLITIYLVNNLYLEDIMPKGIYETVYGNAAYVSGPKAKTAYDLDMAARIPMSMVTKKFLRKAEKYDIPSMR
jgi:hypothetical protein